jgi:hypothetical protein
MWGTGSREKAVVWYMIYMYAAPPTTHPDRRRSSTHANELTQHTLKEGGTQQRATAAATSMAPWAVASTACKQPRGGAPRQQQGTQLAWCCAEPAVLSPHTTASSWATRRGRSGSAAGAGKTQRYINDSKTCRWLVAAAAAAAPAAAPDQHQAPTVPTGRAGFVPRRVVPQVPSQEPLRGAQPQQQHHCLHHCLSDNPPLLHVSTACQQLAATWKTFPPDMEGS